jgi:hypothetical protein
LGTHQFLKIFPSVDGIFYLRYANAADLIIIFVHEIAFIYVPLVVYILVVVHDVAFAEILVFIFS